MEYMESKMQEHYESGNAMHAELEKVTAERDALAAQVEAFSNKLQNVAALVDGDGFTAVQWILDNHAEISQLVAATPQHHLRQVRADAVDEFMNKATHEIANSYTSSTPLTPWESGMNSMLAMFARYTQKYLKILRNNESTRILAGKK